MSLFCLGLKRQVEAKREALEKLKANSTVRETQAEIYSLEQDAYEEARKLKVGLLVSYPQLT